MSIAFILTNNKQQQQQLVSHFDYFKRTSSDQCIFFFFGDCDCELNGLNLIIYKISIFIIGLEFLNWDWGSCMMR